MGNVSICKYKRRNKNKSKSKTIIIMQSDKETNNVFYLSTKFWIIQNSYRKQVRNDDRIFHTLVISKDQRRVHHVKDRESSYKDSIWI